MSMAAQRLKLSAACLLGLLLGGGAISGALKGLFTGQVFCLLCRRNAPPVPWRHAPGLFLLNELMLLGLGALCLAGVWFGVRRLLSATTPDALDPPISPRRSPRPSSLHATARTLGQWLLLGLGWALLAAAAWLGAAISADLVAGSRLQSLVAGCLGVWGGALLVLAGRGWIRTAGLAALVLVVALVVGAWLGR